MLEQLDDKTIVLDRVQDTLVFVYALCNLPIGHLIKHTYYHNGLPLFPLESLRVANSKFQNYKRAIRKNSKAAKDKIQGLAIIDHTTLLNSFDTNIYIETLVKRLEEYMMSRQTANAKKYSPPRQQAGGATKHNYFEKELEDDQDDDESYAEQSFHNDDNHMSPLIRGGNWSPMRNTVTTMVGYQHQKPVQLVESADIDAKYMSLTVMVGNRRISDNGKNITTI